MREVLTFGSSGEFGLSNYFHFPFNEIKSENEKFFSSFRNLKKFFFFFFFRALLVAR